VIGGRAFAAALRARARAAGRRAVLPEGDDPRVREAACRLAADGLALPTLIGSDETASWAVREAPGVSVRIPAADPSLGRVAALLLERRPLAVPGGIEEARRLAADPLRFAAGLVALGEADCSVAGAVTPTADVLRAAIWAVGPAAGTTTVSSAFYMVTQDRGVLTFTDCGVVQTPSAEQLAEIAAAAARDRRRIVGDEPVVAFLSHSTLGSAEGGAIPKVREALARFRAMMPDVAADGELQGDAALHPDVATRKAPGSAVAGRANVLVFPDLDSGNIAYTLVQWIGGATALGPIVQGLRRPCADLSRGAAVDDIVLITAIAALQVGADEEPRGEDG
jgi:phosphate acetyltransferase